MDFEFFCRNEWKERLPSCNRQWSNFIFNFYFFSLSFLWKLSFFLPPSSPSSSLFVIFQLNWIWRRNDGGVNLRINYSKKINKKSRIWALKWNFLLNFDWSTSNKQKKLSFVKLAQITNRFVLVSEYVMNAVVYFVSAFFQKTSSFFYKLRNDWWIEGFFFGINLSNSLFFRKQCLLSVASDDNFIFLFVTDCFSFFSRHFH